MYRSVSDGHKYNQVLSGSSGQVCPAEGATPRETPAEGKARERGRGAENQSTRQ